MVTIEVCSVRTSLNLFEKIGVVSSVGLSEESEGLLWNKHGVIVTMAIVISAHSEQCNCHVVQVVTIGIVRLASVNWDRSKHVTDVPLSGSKSRHD